MNNWNIQKSLELYKVPAWGRGYFGVNRAGHVTVRAGAGGADGTGGAGEIDLHELVEDLRERGLRTPLLLRFSNVLEQRIENLARAFDTAMREHHYRGRFRGVYPIKVNPQRHVVEEVVAFGAARGIGLEAGSKPELLIALALLDTRDALIICNGYKDRAYIETALLAQRLGRQPVIVIERAREVELVLKVASELGIAPRLGVRARLSTKGAGKWVESTGDKSKFGLTAMEMVEVVERLRASGLLSSLTLLHFHIGSQITEIRAHTDALREAMRIFVGLHALGATPEILDVGGGLGVDYDGSQTHSNSSKNYSMQEYANDIVATLQEAADEAGLAHPHIVTEAGRWMVAHHSLLVFDVLGVNELGGGAQSVAVSDDDPTTLHNLDFVRRHVNRKNLLEYYHDALRAKEESTVLFNVGQLDLHGRARVERLFWECCDRIQNIARTLPEAPEELQQLQRALADTYYGNFSVFQSAPDHWAVKQLFPVMPIHRLDEEPTRRGIIADLTCDSDGKIDSFIDTAEHMKDVLELHALNGRPYYLGMFLLGAYQEILGDLHNLFGDANAVHVRLEEDGSYAIDHVVEGEDVKDVLAYVEYDQALLKEKVRRQTERRLREKRMSLQESTQLRRRYDQGLWGYTYLASDE